MSKKIIVHKKETEQFIGPEVSPATPPKPSKHRLIFVAIIAIISLVFNVVQYQSVADLEVQVNNLQQECDNVTAQKQAILQNASDLQEEVSSLQAELQEKQKWNDTMADAIDRQIPNLRWYEENIALVNNYHGNCAYHTISCHHLGSSFYVFNDTEALNIGCWACSDCH